ncbi:hypothetical protein SDC9_132355 [bioreactor metagenome]|uniref:Uncharacterized protein n=1 Tax=bioreactor metagenome TaxID=1076179 RepID=A0A645D7V6_9ZZZZ
MVFIIHGGIHIGPVQGESSVACRKGAQHIVFDHLKRLGVSQAVLQGLIHEVKRLHIFGAVQSGVVVLIHETAAECAGQACIVADQALGLRPAGCNGIFHNALILQDLGVGNQLIPSGRNGINAGLSQQIRITKEVLTVIQPRHPIILALILCGVQRALVNITSVQLRHAIGDIQDQTSLCELCRPDAVAQHHIVAAALCGGQDLGLQLFIGHKRDIDLDTRVGRLKISCHSIDVVLAVAGLLHKQSVQRDFLAATGGCGSRRAASGSVGSAAGDGQNHQCGKQPARDCFC